jgi:dihydrofolate reductase
MKQPRISIIAAVARNGVIGRGSGLPWRMSSDLRRFKEITMGKPVIMGRKTWEGLPRRPLPGRHNIVITRHAKYKAEGATVVSDPQQALALAKEAGGNDIFIIGGSEIFKLFLPMADRLYLTEVDLAPEGDAYFPALGRTEWRENSREVHRRGEGDDASFTLRVLDRVAGAPQD